MATSLSALSLALAAALPTPTVKCTAAAAAVGSASTQARVSGHTGRVVAALKMCLPLSAQGCSVGRRHGEFAVEHRVQWRRAAKATGADSNQYSPLEFMDPETGEYKDMTLTAEEEDYDIDEDDFVNEETDREVLKQFARTIGLEDSDDVDSLFQKMRNPDSDTIVKQLEDGIIDADDMLKAMYGDTPEFRELYTKIESLIGEGDTSSAHDIVEGNYVAVMDELNAGIFGVEQVAMLDILAFLFLRLEDKDAAEQLLGQANELLELLPDDEGIVDNILEHIATMYAKLKKPKQAVPLFLRSLKIKQASEDNIPSIVRTMMGLASAYSDLQLGEKSIELYRKILAYTEEALGSEDEDLAAPLMHLGSSLLDEGRVDEAEMMIDRAVRLTENTFGGKDGRYGVALCVLAQIKGTRGKFELALDYFRKGLQIIEVCNDFNQNDASLDTVRMDVAALLTVMGREKEAQQELKKAKVLNSQQYAYYASQQVEYLEKQAELYAEAGELEKAERALRQSLQLLSAAVGPDSVQVSVVLQLLATLLHAQPDRQSEAEPLARNAVQIRETKFGPHHIATGETYSCLASILHHQGQDAEAADLMFKVLHIQEKEMGVDHPQLEEALDVLNMLLVNLGRHREASAITQRIEQLKSETSFSL